MKRAQLNLIILATYLALAIGLVFGLISISSQMAAAKNNVDIPEDNGKFAAYDILIADEISFYVGEESVIVPYLMSVDGSIKNTRFEYVSSSDAIVVDNIGNVKVLRDPGEDAFITITDQRTGATKTVKVKVISSLSAVLGILDSSGHLIHNKNQSFITGKSVTYTVNTEPKGLDVSGLCSVSITDKNGNAKSAFEISYERNTIKLNPVGIGAGHVVITVKSPDGEVLNKTEFDFNISMENKALSDELLNRSGVSLMVGSDFDNITTVTINSSITDMKTLNILSNLKTVIINSASVVNLKNINSKITYKVPYSSFLDYCQSDAWRDHIMNLVPYDQSNESQLFVVYHDTNNGTVEYSAISSDMTLPQYSEIKGQKHTGWKNAKGEAVSAASIKKSKESIHVFTEWTSVYCNIVYHIPLFGDEYSELWSYDENKGLKDITTFPHYEAKNGYQFLGWSTDAWYEDVTYVNGHPLSEIEGVSDGATIHLYAVWKIFTYTVTFDYDEKGYYTGWLPDAITVSGDSYVLPELSVGDAYEFDGWELLDSEGKVIKKLKPGENNYPLATEDGQIVTLRASVDEIKYMIRFEFDGANCKDEDGKDVKDSFDISMRYSDEFVAPCPWMDGKEFLYWKASNGNIYYHGDVITGLSRQMVLIKFTAVWQDK